MQPTIKTGQTWRNKKTGQDYNVFCVVKGLGELASSMKLHYQAGSLRKVSGERLFLNEDGYYNKSQTDLGELVAYEGPTGNWARTIEDFKLTFELIGDSNA